MSVLIKGMDMPNSCNECRLLSQYGGWYDDKKTESYHIFICHGADEFFYDSHDDEVQPDLTVRQDFCPIRDNPIAQLTPVSVVSTGFYDKDGNEIMTWDGTYEGITYGEYTEEKRTNVKSK